MRLIRNLTAGEIVEQALLARRAGFRPTNVVFMGMGEPLDNYDAVRRAAVLFAHPGAFGLGARRVTISTVGVVPGIRRLAADRVPARLTVSLTAPEDGLRSRLLPVNRAWPIAEVVAAAREWSAATRRAPTLAYVLLRGVNDDPSLAAPLAAIARSLGAKINLIPYNAARGFERPDGAAVARFRAALDRRGVLALLRRERGGDIAAACGQLATAGGGLDGAEAGRRHAPPPLAARAQDSAWGDRSPAGGGSAGAAP
jgi:23S rRNA (adenine2503-C2)-methyltransferase